MNCEYEDKIFSVSGPDFENLALDIFRFQVENNEIYGKFIQALKIDPSTVTTIGKIPFLPISFFKSHEVVSGQFLPEIIFESSGTTGSLASKHFVKNKTLYIKSFTDSFRLFYGDPKDWCILGLLPSYLERSSSSLVLMVDELIRVSGHRAGGFYLYNHESLKDTLLQLELEGQRTLLIGVSFGLLDFGEHYNLFLDNCTVMETGGMKGRRSEITRQELHRSLIASFGVQRVHSEYGMTELLSQAYSPGEGLFSCPPWMRVLVREDDDPLSLNTAGKGILNIIDLANLYSCSFIATDDIGIVYNDQRFEVQGRMDHSDVRGCSLMVSDMK
jgi:hypothetical protein